MVLEDKLQVPWLKNENVDIWRYINLEKYISMLQNRSLFFSSANNFSDGYEGLGTKKNREVIKVDSWKNRFFLNCWHIGKKESTTMWDSYGKINNSIVIKSSYKRLFKCLDADRQNDFYVGPIAYVDFDKDNLDVDSPVVRHFIKRDYFKNEQELRAAYIAVEHKNGRNGLKPKDRETGINLNVDLEYLIDKIVISPSADKWYFDLVIGLTKKYDFNFLIESSQIKFNPDSDY